MLDKVLCHMLEPLLCRYNVIFALQLILELGRNVASSISVAIASASFTFKPSVVMPSLSPLAS